VSTSEAVTRNIRVQVEPDYDPSRSDPQRNHWFFLYTVRLTNEGRERVQLVSRHWIITDATGQVEEVRGPGVVGKQPVLEPGESFEYTSMCPLSTPWGSMRGTYQMVTSTQERFEIVIPTFALTAPYATTDTHTTIH
jgi:ApaG protein